MKGSLPILVIEHSPQEQDKISTSFSFNDIKNPVHYARNKDGAFDYLASIFYNPAKRHNPLPGVIILSHYSDEDTALDTLNDLKAHSIYCQIPIIIFSDSVQEADMNTFYAFGCAGYFIKPATQEGYCKMLAVIYDFWLHLSIPYYSIKG